MTRFEHLLVTTDFSDESLAGVRTAADMTRQLGGRLSLVFVVDERLPPVLDALPEADRDLLLERHRKKAQASLEEIARRELGELPVEIAVLEGTPHEEIVAAAETRGADLIVMGTHGYGRIASLVFGSTAERVLHHAPCPVLLVRARAQSG